MESRNLFTVSAYFVNFIFLTVIGLYSLADPNFKNSETVLYEEKVTRRYVDETLQAKNKKLNELKARERELLKQTAE